MREEDWYEAMDAYAPEGSCLYCGAPFGQWRDGFITFRFDKSDWCTECQYHMEREEKERNRRFT